MADQEYNRGSVGGTNWWDSSSAAATRTAAAATDSGAALSTSCSSVVFPQDHSLQVMGLGLSSQPLDQWNHPLLRGGDKAGAEIGGGGFRSMLQQGMAPFSAGQTQKLFLGSADADEVEAAEPEFKPIKGFSSVDQQFLDSSSSSVYGNFQGLMGASDHAPPHQPCGYGYHHQQPPNYGMSNSESLMGSGGGWASSDKADHHHQFLKPNSMADPNKPIHSQYSGGGSFWNMAAAAAAMADMPRPAASSFFPVASPLIQQHQINIPCFDEKPQHNVMEVRDTSGPGRKTSGSSSEQTTTSAPTATTSTGGTASKRSRNEASSTLPPFKVRKEKMGDRITALQQLVSPFGKTDTASVLSEAIEYIKFLHEQVNVLSTPYLKSGASLQSSDKSKDLEGPRQDLRSRGLCLVPVSSTFPVAHETTVDFWTPTFGGTFR